ncbi:hypothetical protein KFE25_012751 [Diacronema lutheri]|uniref:Translation factor GUF1 homolog, mitochondrial n=1 Tax=Diacronema lutheri TaxID=2081491 RepID=A0A8J6C490_DIALT|nr:hypothetical protein KFE25_012751 [Diacronema lutheri]
MAARRGLSRGLGRALSSRSAVLRAAKLGPAEAPPAEERIRNFCIIAHVDHGKSTLADRLLEATGAIATSAKNAQVLDTMELERERGITIKLQAARMTYTAADGHAYILNLIDTPGHVDFGYEVERSLQACEGAILVVDASQGVEAQTIAVVQSARAQGLEIVPVLNKIDLPTAQPDRVAAEVQAILGLDCTRAIHASAKERRGIGEILEAVVARVPPPRAGSRARPLRCLVFDSSYDAHRGVIASVRVVDGALRLGDRIAFLNSGAEYEALELGVLVPHARPVHSLAAGEVGYVCGAIRALADAKVGETLAHAADARAQPPRVAPLPGYREPRPMVFCGLFLHDGDRFELLRDSLAKLALNDASLVYTAESSLALGSGFRVGFLGLLHMEVVQQRLEREYGLELVMTAPSVAYRVTTTRGERILVDSPDKFPEQSAIASVEEPFCAVEIIAPFDCTGALMELCQEARGEFGNMQPAGDGRVLLQYALPLGEVISGFFDSLKSRSRGYASMDYAPSDYRAADIVKLDVLINGERAAPLAMMVHRAAAQATGRRLAARLKELIPRQQFRVPIQAALGAKVIAAEHIAALRKDVTAKCYGGDQSRKKKLLMRQAEGKKRMKEIGRVSVPQSAFMACLSLRGAGSEAAAGG